MNQIDKTLPSKKEVDRLFEDKKSIGFNISETVFKSRHLDILRDTLDELLDEKIRGSDIKKAPWHDAGAYGRCSYCGRYSDRQCCLDDRVLCDCGKKGGFSGSFVKPDKNSVWSESR